MTLLEIVASWQEKAIGISAPAGTDRLPSIGGLKGPAFFPEGYGMSGAALEQMTRPTIMAIGHNFGSADYRKSIQDASCEDDKATWRNLDSLFTQIRSTPDDCYRTNWFIGLLPGNKQTGRFLHAPDPAYERACLYLLIEQIRELRPRAILLLGPEVARRAYMLAPTLEPWRGAKNWAAIDNSSIGHSPRNVEIPAANLCSNVVALLHPSFGAANQSRRMRNMPTPTTEAALIKAALSSVRF